MQLENLKFSRIIFIFLCLCPSFQTLAQEFQTIHDGVEYAQFKRNIKPDEKGASQAVVNALRLDLKKARLDGVHAKDAAIGVERTSSLAARHNAVAAINGGFFRIKDDIFRGDATGALVIDGIPFSEPFANRIALFVNNDDARTEIDFKHFSINYSVHFGKTQLPVTGINRQRGDNELIVFSRAFHGNTLTDAHGIEVVVNSKNRIIWIADGEGSNWIPRTSYIISASGEMRERLRQVARIGAKVTVGIRFGEPKKEIWKAYEQAEDILGGVPQLIKNGKIEITWQEEKASEKFVTERNPRTAIAKLNDGRALLVTVDGRQENVSAGMNLQELAEMLLEMGATDAMNLDGGGSTTMFLDGKIVNRPSDKEGERPVSDAILVTLRK